VAETSFHSFYDAVVSMKKKQMLKSALAGLSSFQAGLPV